MRTSLNLTSFDQLIYRPNLFQREYVPAGAPWDGIIRREQSLRIIDLHGKQGVDFLCYNAQNTSERYHAPNTLKSARNIKVSQGSILYSDYANPMMTVTEDTTDGGHDTIAGCCSAWSNEMLYSVKNTPGCRENFLSSLKKYDGGWRDIVPNINFFCKVPVYGDGSTEGTVFVEANSEAGDYVELRAEMDVLVIISNCPQVNNPCNNGQPTDIEINIFDSLDLST